MTQSRFRAWVLREPVESPSLSLEELPLEDLPPGEVLVEVHWSSLNYKDALALTGKGRIARRLPLVPGIDLAGIVRESSSDRFKPGDEVLACASGGIGEFHWGGYADYARMRADWLFPVPPALGIRRAMAVGTAGYTAALAVMTLEGAGVSGRPERPVLVTGASGGLGGIAVVLLAAAGHTVAALTGRPENEGYLRRLGASEIILRSDLAGPARPLESQRWAGAVDTVGGDTLAHVLAQTYYGGSVAACGNASGNELHMSVMPFILRSVSLLGISVTEVTESQRSQAWETLARDLPIALLDEMTREGALTELPELADDLISGRVRGRTVIDVRR